MKRVSGEKRPEVRVFPLGTILKNILRRPLLRSVALLTLAAAVAYPIYDVVYEDPSFDRMLIKIIEEDAIYLAENVMNELFPGIGEMNKGSFSAAMKNNLLERMRDFRLEKLKVYSWSGETVFSTDPTDIGIINKEAYFRDIVAAGNYYTKAVKKEGESLEGRVVKRDVVETYVPIMRDDTFLGAFEIYYDITEKKARLGKLLGRSSSTVIGIGSIFTLAVFLVLFRASKATLESRKAQEELAQAHGELEERVRQRTVELAQVNDELRKTIAEGEHMQTALKRASDDWRATFDSTRDMIVMTDAEVRIVKVNRATALYFDRPYLDLIGLNCLELFAWMSPTLETHPLWLMGRSRRHGEAEAYLAR